VYAWLRLMVHMPHGCNVTVLQYWSLKAWAAANHFLNLHTGLSAIALCVLPTAPQHSCRAIHLSDGASTGTC
jgi:hypothetical protein